MILIREAEPHDTGALRELFKICFGKEVSEEEWLWKYRRSPLGSSSFVAVFNGKVIAHYGGFRLRFYSEGRVLSAMQGCDVMTHPDFRARIFSKRGIIIRTAEAFFKANQTEFIYGFPSERHGRLKALQLGFERHRHICLLRKRVKKPLINLMIVSNKGWNHISSYDIDRIWYKTRDNLSLSIEKLSSYIFWRYRDRPNNDYEVISFRWIWKKELAGYAIVKQKGEILHVLELFSTSKAYKTIASSLEEYAFKKGCHEINLWLNPSERLYKVFIDMGYGSGQAIPLIVKVFEGSSISGDYFYNNYSYRMGDYDAS